jgi:ADP-heptose:LPS heptosyltransferase
VKPLKTVERSLRRAFLAATVRPFTGTLVTEPSNALGLGDAPRLLLLRQDRIGDVLVSVPVVRALRRRHPHAVIHMLFSRTNYEARHALHGYLDHAWRYDKTPASALRLVRALRRERYDAVIDLIDNPSTSARLAAAWCGARYRVGIRHAHAAPYTHAVPLLDQQRVHIVERIAQLLLPFGIDPAIVPLDLEYALEDAARARARERLGPRTRPLRLGVNISGASRARYWGVANFIACLRWMGDYDSRFAIFVGGSPAYGADAAAIAAASGAGLMPPVASFHEYAAMVREFDLLLTPDTSVIHLGAAWKIPTVGLYHQPAGAPLPWYPYRSPYRAVLHPDGVERIRVADVQAAIAALVEERFPRP